MKKPYALIALIYILSSAILFAQKKKEIQPVPFRIQDSIVEDLKFRSMGPALNSGRIADFAVVPGKPSTYYAAVASGGVWKTENSGITWTPVFDGQGSYSIGCVTIDPNNSNTIWVGSGENNNQRSVAYGDGIYKSVNGGKTWKNMGLRKSEHIGMILVHPANSQIIYVAAYGPLWSSGGDRGIYKSTDGGTTWERILFVSDNTGFNEIHMDPRNRDILYATAHQRRRHVFTYISGGPESAIYKSIDGGKTWNKSQSGLPDGDLGRIGLAISPANPDILYAIVEASSDKSGFYRSTDRGESWNKMSSYSSSGNYYQEIVCDPVNPDRVYSLDTYLQVTDDGGKNFRHLGESWKHVDNHALWINPENPDYYLAGCDGGIYQSYDRGTNWEFIANLPVTQFYRVTTDNDYPFYNVYGGTQDNFSVGGPSRTINSAGIINSDWYVTASGDGFESAVDPENPDIIYAESQYGGLVRFDRKSGELLDIRPVEPSGEPAYRWNWDSPLLISPHQSKRIYFAANKVFRSNDRGETWEIISGDLTRQINRDQLEVMGKIWGIDAVARGSSTSFYGNIVALAESPFQEGFLYAGTDDGLIQITVDGGKNWTRISEFPGVPDKTYVSYITPSQHDKNTVYAAFNNYQNGDFRPYILKSGNGGQSWISIASNLPERGSVYCIAEDHERPKLLFAGTEFGVFFTINGGESWTQLKGGLPTIAVRDMAIQKRENDLVVATFGRGFYILDDYTPLKELSKELTSKESHIFQVKDSWMYIESRPFGYKSKSFLGASFYAAANPPLGAQFSWYLKDDIKTLKEKRQGAEKEAEKAGKKVEIPTFEQIKKEDDEIKPKLIFTITDKSGSVIRRLEAEPKAGIHRIVWDFHYPPTSPVNIVKPSDTDPFSEVDNGPLALPGEYTVSLSKLENGKITELAGPVRFVTKLLNNTSLPAQDKESLFTFQKRIFELRRISASDSKIISEQQDKIKYIREAVNNTPSIPDSITVKIGLIELKLKNLNRALNGDASIASRNYPTPPSVSDRVNGAIFGLWQSTSAPTNTQLKSISEAEEIFTSLHIELKGIIEKEMDDLDHQLDKFKAPWTPGRFPDWK
jgi:photosystem II stability/assembly factor-like uncharacterized protein